MGNKNPTKKFLGRNKKIKNMSHVAIMKKSLGFLPKILNGSKKIESRWMKSKRIPLGQVSVGDAIFFKNTGQDVTVCAKVSKVLEFSNLSTSSIKALINKYSKDLGLVKSEEKSFLLGVKDKKHALFVWVNDPKILKKPFKINKTGFGNMASWISITDINNIKIPDKSQKTFKK